MNSRLEACFNRAWYGGACAWLVAALWPSSLLFARLAALRRQAYALGWRRVERMPVPVVVVGNLTAGGAGKTPLTLALARMLADAGWRPGILSRGYGAAAQDPVQVPPDGEAARYGDEPLLLARRAGCPVWIGRRRADAGRGLLAAHPGVDVLLADDGLQHYALARDVEIAVIDARRGLGNGLSLPAGPLREPAARLARVDAVVIHGASADAGVPGLRAAQAGDAPRFAMHLEGAGLVNLTDERARMPVEALRGQRVRALAGIADPQRFFDLLRRLGLEPETRAFPDHHAFVADDLPPGLVLMTEKDAVKCAPLARRAGRDDCWYLAVDARLDAGLQALLLSKLEPRHGPQAA